jgi:hypothetical protein
MVCIAFGLLVLILIQICIVQCVDLNLNSMEMPTLHECNASYGKRDYLWTTEIRLPPMLLTFPGSGTTMSQMLIEYATGIYTGSVYPEDELYSTMPGLEFCGQRLSLIKAHFKDVIFKTTPSGEDDFVTFKTNSYVAKCRRGMIYSFDRFIIVLRSPWAAIWSNYQRDYNGYLKPGSEDIDDKNKKSHSSKIPINEFNYTSWSEKLLKSPHYGVDSYNFMWNHTLKHLFSKYNYLQYDDINYGNSTYYHDYNNNNNNNNNNRKNRLSEIKNNKIKIEKEYEKKRSEWIATGQKPDPKLRVPYTGGNDNILIVRYEDLIHKERRLHVLRSMVDFTGLGYDRISSWKNDPMNHPNIEENEKKRKRLISTKEEHLRKLKCAFILSDREEVHRTKTKSASSSSSETVIVTGTGAATETVQPLYTKLKDAYNDMKVVCKAWNILQHSKDELMRYGYYHGPLSHEQMNECYKFL